MSRRSQPFVVVLVAVLIVGTCSVLFAHAGTASPDPCARGSVGSPTKSAPTAVTLLDISAIPGKFRQVPKPAVIRLDIPERGARPAAQVAAEPRGPRAPPTA